MRARPDFIPTVYTLYQTVCSWGDNVSSAMRTVPKVLKGGAGGVMARTIIVHDAIVKIIYSRMCTFSVVLSRSVELRYEYVMHAPVRALDIDAERSL